MKRNLLILIAMICFMSQSALSESAESTQPNKEQPGTVMPVQKTVTSDKGSENKTSKEINIPKNEEKKTPDQPINNADKPLCSAWLVLFSLIPAIMFICFLIVVKKALKDADWSLGDALSESEVAKDPTGAVLRDKDGNPVFIRSSSRLMAFIGFFGIIVWIVGLSIPTLYQFACTGKVPELNGVSTFLLAQAGVFAPYIANKLAGAVKS